MSDRRNRAIDDIKHALNDRLNEQNEEIRKNGASSSRTARKIEKLTDRWNALEAEQNEVSAERSQEISEIRAEIKTVQDAQKAFDEIMEQTRKRAARGGGSATKPSARSMRQDIKYRLANIGVALITSEGYNKALVAAKRNGERIGILRDFGPDQYREDFVHTLDNVGDLRNVIREAAVFDPMRPAVLRDLLPVIPLTGAITSYARETYWHPITSAAEAITIAPAGTDDIVVDNSSGFMIGSVVYGDAAKTKSGVVNSIDTDLNTVNVTSTAGFTLAAGDQLWSAQFTPTPEGLQKPAAALSVDEIQILTKTHAEMATLTRQALRDIPTLNRTINGKLAGQLTIAEEDQFLFGTGVGPELQGIMNTPGINNLLWSASGVTSDKQLDALRRSKTPVTKKFFTPNGAIMSPDLWETMELTKGSDQHYVFVQAPLMDTTVPMIWKLRVVETTAMRQTVAGDPGGAGLEQALIGDFRVAAAIRERESIQLSISDSHEDYFAKNKLAMRAEIDSGIEVYYPQALTRLVLDAAPT